MQCAVGRSVRLSFSRREIELARYVVQVNETVEAALRRLACLTATRSSPSEILAAVVSETLRVVDARAVELVKFETDGTPSLLVSEPAEPLTDGNRLSRAVRQTGRPAGADGQMVAVPIHLDGELWGAVIVRTHERILWVDATRRLSGFIDLVAPTLAAVQNKVELESTRSRLITAADAVGRNIQCNLHDGAQQRVVSLALRLRGAEASTAGAMDWTAVFDELQGIDDDLRAIARSCYPRILDIGGLRVALVALARRAFTPVDLDVSIDRVVPSDLAAAAYYVVAESITNADRYARAARIVVSVDVVADELRIDITDDGIGGAVVGAGEGSGLMGLTDRVHVHHGRLTVRSQRGDGTHVQCVLPLPVAGPAPGTGSRWFSTEGH